MAKTTNGIMLKLTIGAMVTLSLFTVGAVWRAAGIAGSVEANCKEISVLKPVVHASEISIELFKKDIERILKAQAAMDKKNEENTRLIIKAIQDGN